MIILALVSIYLFFYPKKTLVQIYSPDTSRMEYGSCKCLGIGTESSIFPIKDCDARSCTIIPQVCFGITYACSTSEQSTEAQNTQPEAMPVEVINKPAMMDSSCYTYIHQSCTTIQDVSLVKILRLHRTRALYVKYGKDAVKVKSQRILYNQGQFLKKVNDSFADKYSYEGTIIIVQAGDEGFIFQDNELGDTVYQTTLADFQKKTANTPADIMKQFYSGFEEKTIYDFENN
jgi:hypothetical protein